MENTNRYFIQIIIGYHVYQFHTGFNSAAIRFIGHMIGYRCSFQLEIYYTECRFILCVYVCIYISDHCVFSHSMAIIQDAIDLTVIIFLCNKRVKNSKTNYFPNEYGRTRRKQQKTRTKYSRHFTPFIA